MQPQSQELNTLQAPPVLLLSQAQPPRQPLVVLPLVVLPLVVLQLLLVPLPPLMAIPLLIIFFPWLLCWLSLLPASLLLSCCITQDNLLNYGHNCFLYS